jgi:predicted MFS family arabinose efflux permease
VVFRDPQLRQLVLLAWLAAFWVVPEGLAAPYADALGGGGTAVGLLLAAAPAGTVLGSLVLTRLVAPARRRGLLVPLAAVSGVSMLLCASGPSLPVVLVLLMVSGVGCSYQLVANAMFMQTVPAGHRAEAFGLVSTGLYVGQGLGVLAAGAAADQLAPHVVVAIAGGLGLVLLAGAVGRPTPAGESVGSRYGEAPRRSRAAAGDAGTVPAAPLVSRPSG